MSILAPQKPEMTITLSQLENSGRSIMISYDTLSYKEKLHNGTTISILNVINDYMDELDELSSIVILSNDEYYRYRYKPKLLAYRIYGNTELYYIICLLNKVIDVKDFNFRKLKLPSVHRMNEFLSSVYNAEKRKIDLYNSTHMK